MRLKAVSGVMLTLLSISMLTLAFDIQQVKASGTVYIRADGSIDPPTANITSVDNVTYTFTGNIYDQIVVERSNIAIEGAGHRVHGPGAWPSKGILLQKVSNVIVKNTTITNFYNGIYLNYTSNIALFGNNLIANTHYGVVVDHSSNNIISGNNITNNGHGIMIYRSSNNSISVSEITANNWYGAIVTGSNNIVIENKITNNGQYGIALSGSNNFISGNKITANKDLGIWLSGSSNSIINGNNITDNAYGIFFNVSSNNTIYHNNFVNNAQQVYFLQPDYPNRWDDGYPSGGNYWSNYTGVDVKSGPGQDLPGSDGVGDTPYIIDANNKDRYPLMNPWGAPPPPSYTLTIYSSPSGVTFTVDGVPRTTPWSGTYSEGASVSLVMPEIHAVGGARYYWSQWSDGVTTRSRTVTMNTNITLTAQYSGPYYQLTVTSTPITGITFTIDGAPKTTTYTEWLLSGSYTLVMPETHNGYVWSHWLEDGDTNRMKTITLPGTTWTAVYVPAPPPTPVGGKATPINIQTNNPELPALWTWLTTIIPLLVATLVYVKKRKRNNI